MTSDVSPLPDDATTYFESVARGQIDAINTRDFSIHSPAWAACASNFTAERGGMRGNLQKHYVDLQGLLDEVKEVTRNSPEYHIKLNDCSVQPGATATSAIVHARHAVTGDPPGIHFCVVGVMAFEKIDEEWKLVRYWATMGPPGVDEMSLK